MNDWKVNIGNRVKIIESVIMDGVKIMEIYDDKMCNCWWCSYLKFKIKKLLFWWGILKDNVVDLTDELFHNDLN